MPRRLKKLKVNISHSRRTATVVLKIKTGIYLLYVNMTTFTKYNINENY